MLLSPSHLCAMGVRGGSTLRFVTRFFILSFQAFLLTTLMAGNVWADLAPCPNYSSPLVKRVVDFVHDGVELVECEGESAFKEFSVNGSRWFQGDSYLFVLTIDGSIVCNPPFPQLIGRAYIDFKDVSGKPALKMMLDQVTKYGRDSGWVHYLWPVPGQVQPVWKSAYVHLAQTPDGKKFIIGSGLYEPPMERCFAVQQVMDAAMHLEQHGVDGFDFIGSRTGPFVWGSAYVFIVDEDGVQHVNPGHPNLEGQKLAGARDAKGGILMQRVLDAGTLGEPMWIEYWWPKPGHVAPSEKATFIKPVMIDGKRFIVGCGIYRD